MEAAPKYEDTTELAARWRVHAETVRVWRRERGLPHLRIGGTIRYIPAEVDAWAAQNADREVSA